MISGEPARSWRVDEAYAALRQAILDNDYPPGHQVSAQVLAERFGMSRTPVQEAALRLQQEGLVEILPKRGIRIRSLAPQDIDEIYDVIIAIESAAAVRITRMPDDRRAAIAAQLDAATDTMAAALARQDIRGWGEADAVFHRVLVAQSGNRRFEQIIDTVNAQAHRARMLTAGLRPTLALSVAEHRRIATALADGDIGAGAIAAAHRERVRGEHIPIIARLGLKHL